jgi:predicted MPP superfamily phosphohydrolase
MPVVIQTHSDLHPEFDGGRFGVAPIAGVDLIINVGDVGNGAHRHLSRYLDEMMTNGATVIYVPGNHDGYREGSNADRAYTLSNVEEECRRICERAGAHYLNNDSLTGTAADGTPWRLFGATGWSDFSLRPEWMSKKQAMSLSQNGYLSGEEMPPNLAGRSYHNDYRAIHRSPGKRLSPSDTLAMHNETVERLGEFLAQPFEEDGVTIVATHMPPTHHLVESGTHGWLYGSSDMEPFMHGETAPDLWLCGHVHRSADLLIGDTRLVSNPRGYMMRHRMLAGDIAPENGNWDPQLVLSVELRPAPAPAPGM